MFAAQQAAIFATMGRPAVYMPPGGEPVSVRVIRVGGGQEVHYGSVVVVLDRVRFEVLRSAVPSPVPGATLTVDGQTWTVDGVQPVVRDAHGLKWSLDASWGARIVWRSVAGSGAAQNPPSITGSIVMAAAASAGASVVSVRSTYAVGRLLPGDAMTIDGAVYRVTTTAQASANVFSAVGIAPALAANVGLGDTVGLSFARDTSIHAAISGYTAKELQGGLQSGDIRLVLLPSTVVLLPEAPKIGDLAISPDLGALRIVNVAPVYAGASVAAWEAQARK